MTIDERLEFLLKSTESHHQTAHEISARIREHTLQLKADAENIRSLPRIAEAHERRINNLEGQNP